jgi:hypothetical protein
MGLSTDNFVQPPKVVTFNGTAGFWPTVHNTVGCAVGSPEVITIHR